MRYFDLDLGSSLQDVVRHLRNKTLVIVEDAPGATDRLVRMVWNAATILRHRRLNRSWGRNAKLVVSEQLVENPMVLRSLHPDDRTVLDFGGVESVLPLQLAALGVEVTVLDQRAYPFRRPRLRTIRADVLKDTLDAGPFDAVISVSTIEHVGLGRYGDVVDADGDRSAVSRLWSMVRPGGRLIATVPAGAPATQRGYRVYDEARVRATFPNVTATRWFMKDGREGVWLEADATRAAGLVYSRPEGEAPAEAVVIVECRKPAA